MAIPKIFTDENLKIFGEIIQRTWTAVGDDCFINEEGEMDYSLTFTSAEIAEISLDAQRWIDYSGVAVEVGKPLVDAFWALDYNSPEREEVLDRALPYKIWGY